MSGYMFVHVYVHVHVYVYVYMCMYIFDRWPPIHEEGAPQGEGVIQAKTTCYKAKPNPTHVSHSR